MEASHWWTLKTQKYFWKTPRPREHKLYVSSRKWRQGSDGGPCCSTVLALNCSRRWEIVRFFFSLSQRLSKRSGVRILVLMLQQMDSRTSRGFWQNGDICSTLQFVWPPLASEHLKEPDRETTSLKIKTFTKWYLTPALLFCKRCTLAPFTRLFESYQGAWGVKLWMVGRILFPQVCCVALVSGVNHTSRTLVLWLTC